MRLAFGFGLTTFRNVEGYQKHPGRLGPFAERVMQDHNGVLEDPAAQVDMETSAEAQEAQ